MGYPDHLIVIFLHVKWLHKKSIKTKNLRWKIYKLIIINYMHDAMTAEKSTGKTTHAQFLRPKVTETIYLN